MTKIGYRLFDGDLPLNFRLRLLLAVVPWPIVVLRVVFVSHLFLYEVLQDLREIKRFRNQNKYLSGR